MPLLFVQTACAERQSENQQSLVSDNERIAADKIIKQLANSQNIFYSKVTIAGDLDFTKAIKEAPESGNSLKSYINSSITFIECIFEGKVIAFRKGEKEENHLVTFERNLSIIDSKFLQDIELKNACIKGVIDFSGSSFFKKAIFEGCSFTGNSNNFTKTKYSDEARFQRAYFLSDVTFLYAVFEGAAGFQSAVFMGNVQFGATKFKQYADFSNLTVHNGYFFNYAEFENNVIFNNSSIDSRAEFMNVAFKKQAEFKRIKFSGITKFTQAVFTGKIDFSNSIFFTGKPETTGIIKNDTLNIILENCIYLNSGNLNLEDF
ncbi:MAG: hypothetical protein HY738_20665 [Bacteroidia bacterium]|nr:hypothetical protein [Bacteroidia bacterium]